jgi:hypothetical protein
VSVGLGQRDWVPLLSAIFVDICLLLVSISRPMNRFARLETKMKEAQEWPVIEVLSKFHAIHVDETIRRTFEVLRHVVFNWRGIYYAAIPLNGGEDRGASKEENEKAQLEAYLLNNLFTSFEREQIFKPVPVSMFTSGYIQKKLKQQRSKYAEVEAFRIFKFNNGAWPEMILSAIMGAAKRVEAEQRRMRFHQMAADERAAREQAEAERLAKRARRWRTFVDPLRREPPVLEDGMPDLGEVANDMTGRPQAEPSLVTEPMPAPVAEVRPADPLADVKRMLGELGDLTETIRQQKTVIDAQATTITQLQQPPKPAEMPRAEPYRQAANGNSGGWGSRNGHSAASTSAATRDLDDVRLNGHAPASQTQAPQPGASAMAAAVASERGSRPRSYHDLSEAPAKGPRLATPAQVIPMPYIPYVETPVMTSGSLSARLEEQHPTHRPMLDALIEASERGGGEPIAPIVVAVTPVEPIEEWAPAPGLGGSPAELPSRSSLEDIQRFINQSRQAARNIEAEAHVAAVEQAERNEDVAIEGVERDLEPMLDDGEDQHPTEQAELNVPMITQWWSRKS